MIELIKDTISKSDVNKLIQWLRTNPRLTKGPITSKFESKFSNKQNTRYSTFVNSGSSAILMMLQCLLESKKIQKGDRIVVPALSWSTDFSSVVQLGFEPVICDCNMTDLSVDIHELERIFTEQKPKCLLLVSVLGLVPNMDTICSLCKKYGVTLLEDTCESLGSSYDGKLLGNFGDMSIFSTYFGHHLSTIEGGMVCTSIEKYDDILKCIRNHGWDRDLTDEKKKQLREENDINDFNALYTFYYLGFNFRSTDLQAFLGLGQLDKWESIVQKRNKNYNYYCKHVDFSDKLWVPEKNSKKFVSNFAFPIITKKKYQLVTAFNNEGIQIRPLICGSMVTQPFFKNNGFSAAFCPNAAMIDECGVYIPNHPYLTSKELSTIVKTVNSI